LADSYTCDAEIVPKGFDRLKLRVCSDCLPKVLGRARTLLEVPLSLLRADAAYSILGETAAGFLLGIYAVEGECPAIREVAETYRRRVIIEELYQLYSWLGGILRDARVSPLYIPAVRAWRIGGHVSSIISRQLHDSTREELEETYHEAAASLGLLRDGKVNVRAVRSQGRAESESYRRGLEAAWSVYRKTLGQFLSPIVSDEQTHMLVENPGLLVELPEGSFTLEKHTPETLSSQITGDGTLCRPPSPLSSSLTCRGEDGRAVVKIYGRLAVKWLPATIASPREARYLVTPKARMANEYYWLRRLRKAVATPRIHALAVNPSRMMLRDYIPGVPAFDSEEKRHWETAGRTLAFLHKHGVALGDPNPGNFIVDEENPDYSAIVDAEQARPYAPVAGAWDLVVFTVYPLLFGRDKSLVESAVEAYRLEDPELYRRHAEILSQGIGWGGVKLLGPVYLQAKRILLG